MKNDVWQAEGVRIATAFAAHFRELTIIEAVQIALLSLSRGNIIVEMELLIQVEDGGYGTKGGH